jgi:hypothetical protein
MKNGHFLTNIASIKDPLFDTFKDGKNDNLIQIRRAKLLLKRRESSFRRNVVDNRIETDAFSKRRVTLKEVNQLPCCKTVKTPRRGFKV